MSAQIESRFARVLVLWNQRIVRQGFELKFADVEIPKMGTGTS